MYDVAFRERAAYLPEVDALVVADLHAGRAAASAVDFPLGERGDLRDRLTALVEADRPSTVVFAGDVLHQFGPAPEAAASALDDLVEVCRERGAEAVAVAGNHDGGLEAAWPGEVRTAYRTGGVIVCHGHEAPDPGVVADGRGGDGDAREDVALYVIGHDHPAIEIEGQRHPCFLWGEGAHRGRDVLVVPAFTELAAGVPVNGLSGRDAQSPLLDEPGAFRPIVREEDGGETFVFPALSEFRDLL